MISQHNCHSQSLTHRIILLNRNSIFNLILLKNSIFPRKNISQTLDYILKNYPTNYSLIFSFIPCKEEMENNHEKCPIKRDKCFPIKINIIIKMNFTVIPSIFDNHNIKNVYFYLYFFLLFCFLGSKNKRK